MNSNQIKGAVKEVTGKVRRAAGEVTGNTTQQVKGAVEQVQGKVQRAVGDVQEAAKDASKEVEKEANRKHPAPR